MKRLIVVLIGLLVAIPAVAGDRPLTFTADDPALEWGPCPEFLPEGCGLAVLQGDPAGQNADVFFRLPGGAKAPDHWHTSAERMVLVSGEMHVRYQGHEKVVLKPGTYAYGPSRLNHTARCVSDEDCVLFIAFEEPVDAIEAD